MGDLTPRPYVWRQVEDHRGDRRARGDLAHSHASGVVGAVDTSRAGAAVRTVSRGLIRKPGLVLARADGWARLALVPGCGLRQSGRCEGQDLAETSGALVNFHAVDGSPVGRIECRLVKNAV